MANFILMLTNHDRTVANALMVYEEVRDTPLTYVGFKDIGLPQEEMKTLASHIRADSRKVLLEVVSTSREDELRSIRAAVAIGVDYVLGGRHATDVIPILNGTGVHYFPFCGNTRGHPTRLDGTMDQIVADARRLAMLQGIHGLDLLSYRFSGDAAELTRRVVAAVNLPVIAAGSIDRVERVQAVCAAGVWGFTVGSALFEGRFVKNLFEQQVRQVVGIEGVSYRPGPP